MDHRRPPACDWAASSQRGVIGFRGGRLRTTSQAAPTDTRTWFSAATMFSVEAQPEQRTQVVILPPPVPHLLVADGTVLVCGTRSTRIVQEFAGSRHVVAVALRPCLLAGVFDNADGASLVNRLTPISQWIGTRRAAALAEAVDDADSLPGKVRCLYRLLRLRGLPDGDAAQSRDLVEAVLGTLSKSRVSDAADLHKVSTRTLLRLFKAHLGIGPKAAARRWRLIDAGTSLVRQPENWARLVPQLGYFDQPHFINDFRNGLGITPARFAAQVGLSREVRLAARRRRDGPGVADRIQLSATTGAVPGPGAFVQS
ncbi:helix-turn-helix domain-containing protein (plasmid) [Streptomycetaceae bacterium NBC_01309]